MDLFGGYLLIVLVLFSANIALLFANLKLDNLKVMGLSLGYAAISFALMNISGYINADLSFLMAYFSMIYLMISIIVFLVMLHYTKRNNVRFAIGAISVIFFISAVLVSSQTKLEFFDTILYSFYVLIVLFFVYQISKLLIHAKRPYPIIIGEFMCLFAILMFIFALTYESTITLDYTMFTSFLILTPLYQLVYFIIGIAVLIVIGAFLNDGGKS